jgi:hypothetical protein
MSSMSITDADRDPDLFEGIWVIDHLMSEVQLIATKKTNKGVATRCS